MITLYNSANTFDTSYIVIQNSTVSISFRSHNLFTGLLEQTNTWPNIDNYNTITLCNWL